MTVFTFIPGLVASIHDIISEYPKPVGLKIIITAIVNDKYRLHDDSENKENIAISTFKILSNFVTFTRHSA